MLLDRTLAGGVSQPSVRLVCYLFQPYAEPRSLLKKKSAAPITEEAISTFSAKSHLPLRWLMQYVTGHCGRGVESVKQSVGVSRCS